MHDEVDPAFWGPARRRRREGSGSPVVNLMLAALAVLAAATIVALVVLWPSGDPVRSPSIAAPHTEGARVTRVSSTTCSPGSSQTCQLVAAKLLSGRDTGRTTTFAFQPTRGASPIAVGDRVRLLRNPPPPQGTPSRARRPQYSFGDFDRKLPLLCLRSRSSCCCWRPGVSTGCAR
jgi:hypothetical protein